MRLISVEHTRCAEYDGTEYFLAPEGRSDEWIEEQVDEVVEELIRDARALDKGSEEAPKSSYQPNYTDESNLDKTVREVLAQHKETKEVYAEWSKNQQALKRSFSTRMSERGFLRLWEPEAEEALFKVSTNWGHQHGLSLNYEHSSI